MYSEPPEVFRISPLRPWFLAAEILAIFAAIGVIAALHEGRTFMVPGILTGWAVLSALAFIPIGLAAATSRWDVDAEGIGGRDNWHIYRRVDWSDIDSVTPLLLPGYRFVWVNSRGRRKAFWLPLFLTDMDGFRAAVAQHAPAKNPLRRYLEKKLGRTRSA
jgi:hypothetical protein